MKARIAIAVILTAMAIHIGAAQETAKKFTTAEQKIEFAKKNIAHGLRSGNAGVIESAMRLTALMKMRYPASDVSNLAGIIDEIAAKHPSGTIRYKAYITLNICADPEWYVQEEKVATADDLTFFRNASARMQQKLLGVNSL